MRHLRKILHFGWPYLRRYWSRLVAGVLLGVLFGLLTGSFVWVTKTLVGRMSSEPSTLIGLDAGVAKSGKGPPLSESLKVKLRERTEGWVDPWLPRMGRALDWRQALGALLFVPVLIGLRGFTGYLSSYCLGWVSERVVNDLRIDVLQKLTSLSLDFFNRSKMGDLLTRVGGDTAALQRCLNLGVGDLVKEPMTILGCAVFLWVIDWKLTLGAMVFFPLCVVPIIVFGKKVRRASKAGRQVSVTQSSLLVEMVSGIRVIKAFGLESEQVGRFRRLSQEWILHAMKSLRAKERINPIIETVSTTGFGLLLVYIAWQQRSVEDMVGFLTGLGLFYTPVKKLGSIHIMFEQASAGVERLFHLLEEQPSVREPAQPKPLPQFQQGIRLTNLSFAYDSRPVLRGINLHIPRGMKLGIAGESGSGKSTLVNLLFRFYDPAEGSISIDGLDIREVAVRDLRQTMALVSQEVVLFDQSAAENIACGKPGASRAEIENAAREAHADEFIAHLPQRYDSPLGERGVTLSGGQRQRIAIARAFIRNAPILVLDEATASLDSKSEAEVQKAIDHLAENRTVICVAHRLSTLASMDRIIVLSQGQVVEEGGFTQLLEAGGRFAAMARRQGMGVNLPQSS